MAFGLLSTGFRKKRLEDIKPEIESAFRTAFGQSIDLDPRGPFGQLSAIYAESEALIWQLLEDVYNSSYPDTASGASLDNAAAFTGISRLAATYSTVTVRFQGTLGTVIPVGTVVSVTGVSSTKFATLTSGTMGAGINEVQTLTFSAIPTSGNFQLVYDGTATASLAHNATASQIETALENISGIGAGGLTVTGNFAAGFTITFDGVSAAQKDHPLLTVQANTLVNGGTSVTPAVGETVKGYRPYVDLPCRAQSAGALQALAGTLTVIDTAVFGLDAVTNLLDAVVGRNRETDSELRLRRLELLQTPGTPSIDGIRAELLTVTGVTQALIIENSSNTTDGSGRPAKSFEAYVQGGADADIRAAIFASKPAGIETIGTVTGTVTDSQGFNQTVKFSRPVEKAVWVIVNVTKNTDSLEGDLYPSDGNTQVRDKVLSYGASLRIGRDVWVNQIFSYVNQVPGVKGIQILIGFSNPPTLSANLTIAATEVAIFDSARVTVNS